MNRPQLRFPEFEGEWEKKKFDCIRMDILVLDGRCNLVKPSNMCMRIVPLKTIEFNMKKHRSYICSVGLL